MLNLGHTKLAQFVLREPHRIAVILLVLEVVRAYQRVLFEVLVILPIEMLNLGDRTKSDRTYMNMLFYRRRSGLCTNAAHHEVNVDELISLSPSLSMSKMTRIIKGDLLDHSRSVLCTATPPRKLSVDQ